MVKGAAGLRRCDLLSTLATLKRPPSSAAFRPKGGGLVGNIELLELLAVGRDEPRLESLVLGRGKLGQDRPIFLRLELLDLEFAIADEPERHRLHAAGGTGAGQFPPQDRGQGEAHEIVERAAGEIGVDERPVDRARMAHGVEHRLLGHRVEDDALDRHAGQGLLAVEHLQHMPGDGFALAVGVGREDQLRSRPSRPWRSRRAAWRPWARRPNASRNPCRGGPSRFSRGDRAHGRTRRARDRSGPRYLLTVFALAGDFTMTMFIETFLAAQIASG